MIEISYCQSATRPSASTIPLDRFITALRTGPDKAVVNTIEKIRSLRTVEDEAEITQLKSTLPGVLFGGTFTSRANANLIQASGLMVLDFDAKGVTPKEIDEYAFLRFKSPQGGDREKIVVRIPIVKNDAEYKEYFNGMADYIFELSKPKGLSDAKKLEQFRKTVESPLDLSGKDISRYCFMSYDPDVAYSPDKKIWTTKREKKVKDVAGIIRDQPAKSNANLSQRITNFILKGAKGNRHETCRTAGIVAGGYIAGGGLNEEEMEWLVQDPIAEINDAEAAGFRDDYRTYLSGVQYGKRFPLNEKHVQNIEEQQARFVPDFIENREDRAIAKEMDRIRKEGYERGVNTGWDELDQYYSILPGTSTVVYAAPHIGKTLFVFNMMINICIAEGWKGIIFSPETGSTADIYVILIEIYMGKDAKEADDEEYSKAKAWVLNNFYILNPDKDRFIPSVEDLLAMAEKIIAKDKGVRMLFIDTLGDTNVDFSDERTDKNYIKMMIGLRQWFVNHKAHVFLSSHIVSPKTAGIDSSNGHQIFSIPHESQIKGGQALSQKGFSIIALYQYNPAMQCNDPNEQFLYKGNYYYRNSMYAIIQKVKPHYVGRRGSVHFIIDRAQHRLIEYNKQYNTEPPAPRDFTQSKVVAQQEIVYDQPEPDWAK